MIDFFPFGFEGGMQHLVHLFLIIACRFTCQIMSFSVALSSHRCNTCTSVSSSLIATGVLIVYTN